jgi:hypothetical protein
VLLFNKDQAAMPTARDTLVRITDVLGYPVEVLTGGNPLPDPLWGLRELVKVWCGLGSHEDRARLLAFAHALAERHRDA